MSKRIRVLIVDDSEYDALLVADMLKDHGYRLLCKRVETPEALTESLNTRTWDVIIADYTMPDFSGPEALRIQKESGQDIPLILVSGTAPSRIGIDMMRAGAKDFILKDDLSRLPVAVERELTEAGERRHRRKAEAALREAEAHRVEFYRRTILAATDGKLVICEKDQIESIAGETIGSWNIKSVDDFRLARDEVKRLAVGQGMNDSQVPLLLACMVEATTNAVKHAGGGHASLHPADRGVMFVICDDGPGIGVLALPDVALTKGYSTAGTLGMGYKVMLDTARRIYLATGQDGTTVGVEVALDNTESDPDTILERLSGWREDSR